ncbi:hypothetical protein Hdeb2414_s0114g00799101 [Helianthus debilis subsp. tardiflorus]
MIIGRTPSLLTGSETKFCFRYNGKHENIPDCSSTGQQRIQMETQQ